MKRILVPLLAILAAAAFLGCTSCSSKKKPPPPPVVVQAPDYKPIGEGMKVHSYALIGVAVIIAIALMSKSKNT